MQLFAEEQLYVLHVRQPAFGQILIQGISAGRFEHEHQAMARAKVQDLACLDLVLGGNRRPVCHQLPEKFAHLGACAWATAGVMTGDDNVFGHVNISYSSSAFGSAFSKMFGSVRQGTSVSMYSSTMVPSGSSIWIAFWMTKSNIPRMGVPVSTRRRWALRRSSMDSPTRTAMWFKPNAGCFGPATQS